MLLGDTVEKSDNLEKDKEGIYISGITEFWSKGQYPLAAFLFVVFPQFNKSLVRLAILISVIFWFIHCEPLYYKYWPVKGFVIVKLLIYDVGLYKLHVYLLFLDLHCLLLELYYNLIWIVHLSLMEGLMEFLNF